MGRSYESIYVIGTDGIAIQCPHPGFPSPETKINNAFIRGRRCQAAERAQRSSENSIAVGNRLSPFPSPPWNGIAHKWRRNHLRMASCIIKHTPNNRTMRASCLSCNITSMPPVTGVLGIGDLKAGLKVQWKVKKTTTNHQNKNWHNSPSPG